MVLLQVIIIEMIQDQRKKSKNSRVEKKGNLGRNSSLHCIENNDRYYKVS